ncbi:MAG: hypothetical protein NVS2B7_13810 [Herpetosiphon sp.]
MNQRQMARWLILGAALLTLIFKVSIAATTIGTNDVQTWQHFTEQIRTIGQANLYLSERNFNHPPLIGLLLRLMDWLTTHSHLPFPFWLRLPAIVADFVSVVIVLRLIGPTVPVALLAVCPPLIMISGFHGNTDPVMIMWIILGVWLLERAPVNSQSAAMAGVAIALAISTKIVPVILVPIFLLWLPSWRSRVLFTSCLSATVLVGALPFILTVPGAIVRNVFDYKSIYGQWGIGRILYLGRGLPRPHWLTVTDLAFERYGRLLAGGSIMLLSLWLNWPRRYKPTLFVQSGLILLVFLVVSPGFGVQYLAWIMPWVVVAGIRASMAVYAACGVFLASVYSFWAGQWPWHYAGSPSNGWDSRPDVIAVELLAWASILAATVMLLTTVQNRRQQDVRAAPSASLPNDLPQTWPDRAVPQAGTQQHESSNGRSITTNRSRMPAP